MMTIKIHFSLDYTLCKARSEISNGEAKAASTIADSGLVSRDSFSPTDYSGSNQQEGGEEEEATMYDFDEDCEEFEKQRIISILFYQFLIFSTLSILEYKLYCIIY